MDEDTRLGDSKRTISVNQSFNNKTPAQAFTPPAKKKHVRTGLEIFEGRT